MLEPRGTLGYYYFSFSNFIAALAGGIILTKCIGIIDIPWLQGDSILAFFLGIVFGLILLQLLPKSMSVSFSRWFAICGGTTSLLLIYVYKHNISSNGALSHSSAIIFFIMLTMRFGFWFYSRAHRATQAAGYQKNIAWVELGYFSGMILGLVLFSFYYISITTALLIDALLQFTAGLIDWIAYRSSTLIHKKMSQINQPSHVVLPLEKNHFFGLVNSIIFLTIGAQVITFNLAHNISEQFNGVIIACYYFGTAIAAAFFKKNNLELNLAKEKNNLSKYIIISSSVLINKIRLSAIIVSVLSILSITVAISIYQFSYLNSVHSYYQHIGLLIFIFLTAFFYEIFALAVLDRIGFEERYFNKHGMVMKTYGWMGVGAAISLWIIKIINLSYTGLLFILFISLSITIMMIKRKRISDINEQSISI